MAFCQHCGKQIEDGMKFCPYCGKAQQEIAQETPPVSDPYAAPPGGAFVPPKKQNKGLLIGIICAVVTVAALIVIAVVIFASRKPSGGAGSARSSSASPERSSEADAEDTAEEEEEEDRRGSRGDGPAVMDEEIEQYDAEIIRYRLTYQYPHDGDSVRLMDYTYEIFDADSLPESVRDRVISDFSYTERAYREYCLDEAQDYFEGYINQASFSPDSEVSRLVVGRLDEVVVSFLTVRERQYSSSTSYSYDSSCHNTETGSRVTLDDLISNKGAFLTVVQEIYHDDTTIARTLQEKGDEIDEEVEDDIKNGYVDFLLNEEGITLYLSGYVFGTEQAYTVTVPYADHADLFYEQYLTGVNTLEDAESFMDRREEDERIDLAAALSANGLPALVVNDVRPLEGRWDVRDAGKNPADPQYIRVSADGMYYYVYADNYEDLYSGYICVTEEGARTYNLFDHDDDYNEIQIGTVTINEDGTLTLTLVEENLTLTLDKSDRY